MKLLVISDIHGLATYAEEMIAREQPDEVVFLGDGLRYIKESAGRFGNVHFHFVQGNCDFGGEPEEQCLRMGGQTVFFTHGHHYNVKWEKELAYVTLRAKAAEVGADIVLFGHTHQPDLVYRDGRIIMNPGAVMARQYGVMTVDGDTVKPQLKNL